MFGQQRFERLELLHQFIQTFTRDGGRLRGEGCSQRIVELADVMVLLLGGQAGMPHAITQRLEQRRQAADHFSTFITRDLGAGRPDQIGRRTLHALRIFGLGAAAHRGDRQHIGPDLEQELAHAILNRHLVEHLAQLDRVLDGHGLSLFDLLSERDALH